jgi:hypothetical protein
MLYFKYKRPKLNKYKQKNMEGGKTKQCSYCKKEIDAGATKCPYCQSNLIKKTSVGTIIVIVIIVLFLGAILLTLIGAGSSSGQQQQTGQASALQSCLSQADSDYTTAFQKECIAEGGINNSGSNCKVYTSQASLLDARHQDAIDNCYHAYPQQ